ncbi:MAG: protein-glutamate O-methyltransferase CheR [Spirochaetota bacterium]|nr:protein-glutamate O-methyltransferase CheR [Spirochaetota bacterium]
MNTEMVSITEKEFKQIATLLYGNFGINLTDNKQTLVRGRLNKIIRTKGYENFTNYYNAIKEDKTGMLQIELADKLSTNHSYFFRENDHFKYLSTNTLPEIEKSQRLKEPSELRIWCAGCAAGEEPYTLAILLKEHFGKRLTNNKPVILATDISTSALSAAKSGIYTQDKLKSMPNKYLDKYFNNMGTGKYSVKPDLRNLILFKRLNLMRDTFPFSNKFDIIFCRNVMIYFDKITRETLISKYFSNLIDNGILFIGHSETIGRNSNQFKYLIPAVYRKK